MWEQTRRRNRVDCDCVAESARGPECMSQSVSLLKEMKENSEPNRTLNGKRNGNGESEEDKRKEKKDSGAEGKAGTTNLFSVGWML
ncbi:hypothetical protein STEG23_013634 [Scotinomys teguina]